MIRVLVLLLQMSLILSAREPPQINLGNQGTISGIYITRFRTKRIAAYLGIPYAQPPINGMRFTPPEFTDLPRWDGVRNATNFAPDCLQNEPKNDDLQTPPKKHDELFKQLLESQMEEKRKLEYSEDCLYLNVYVPDEFIQTPLDYCIKYQISQSRRMYGDSCPVFCPNHYRPVCGASKLRDYIYKTFNNGCYMDMLNCRGEDEYTGYVEVPLEFCQKHLMKNIHRGQVVISNFHDYRDYN